MRDLGIKLLFVVGLGLIAAPTHADDFSCFQSLASAAPDGPAPVTLIEDTYLDLLEKLGGELRPETLDSMAKSGSPFSVPDQPSAELHGLRKRLQEFEKMLEGRGWNTSEIRSRLQARAGLRAGDVKAAKTKVDRAIETSWPDQKIVVPGGAFEYFISPDGRWILMPHTDAVRPNGVPAPYYYYDTVTRRQGSTVGSDTAGRLEFAADGKSILSGFGKAVYRLPFVNGTIEWDKPEPIGEPNAKAWGLPPADIKPTRLITRSPDGIYVADPFANTRALLRLGSEPFRPKNLHDWGPIPGTDDLYTIEASGTHRTHVCRYSIDADGNAIKLPAFYDVPTRAGSIARLTPTNQLVVQDGDEIIVYSAPADTGKKLLVPPRYKSGPGVVGDVALRPQTNEVAVLLHTAKHKLEIAWYDLDSGNRTRTTSLPNRYYSNMKLSADGRKLFLYSDFNELALINPDR